ncbi:MAG TPA: hypothetical protein VGH27_01615 [Streptosporangiaceae bacterium]|jgi:hypothetical protein
MKHVANTRKPPDPPMFKGVLVPEDPGLTALLRTGSPGASADVSRLLRLLADAARTVRPPTYLLRTIQLPVSRVAGVAEALTGILRRARVDGDPAAGVLAGFLAGQFGVEERPAEGGQSL